MEGLDNSMHCTDGVDPAPEHGLRLDRGGGLDMTAFVGTSFFCAGEHCP